MHLRDGPVWLGRVSYASNTEANEIAMKIDELIAEFTALTGGHSKDMCPSSCPYEQIKEMLERARDLAKPSEPDAPFYIADPKGTVPAVRNKDARIIAQYILDGSWPAGKRRDGYFFAAEHGHEV